MLKINILFLALIFCPAFAWAQKKQAVPANANIPLKSISKADSLPGAPKPYSQVITAKAKTYNGLFKVDLVGLRYFFEIPDTLLGRDLLAVNRISKSATGIRQQMLGYAGDEISENVIRFEKGQGDRIFLRQISYRERSADSASQGMYHAVANSNLQPIVASFNIKAIARDSTSKFSRLVFDVTDYLNTENEIFFFSAFAKRTLGIGAIQADRTYIENISPFRTNIEIKTVRTYARGPINGAPATDLSTIPITFELNSSILLLPRYPMKPRYADDRVGYFSTGYTDYDANPQGVKNISMITRWRMEPKPEDEQKYKQGELVQPQKPIVFYIDPATPKKWVPYLIAGVNDWQKAFEQAGFKNAIIAKEAPNDSTWSIDDASHSAIVYKPSDVANASGPNVHDPRSGEILEAHINWYHNVMQLIHDWYLIQTGAVDPRARKPEFDDELMGQLIRFVSSHEVGHTLGLLHNYGSSSTVPVEKLRDKAWVEAHGHTPSIMDYARFNYVAQPEDHISEKGLFPRINDYDKWAIQWGYKWLPQYHTADDESTYLNKWIIDSLQSNHRLFFGIENDINDPRSQNEDLGDNAVLAGTYGIKNLKRILPQLESWTYQPNEGYLDLKRLYNQLVNQYALYLGHVTKNIAGIYYTPKSAEQPGALYSVVPYQKQKAAIRFLDENIFTTPEWLLSKDIQQKTGIDYITPIRALQSKVLNPLLSVNTFNKLLNSEYENQHTYTIDNLFQDMKSTIWKEIYQHQPIDVYRRNLQRLYIDECIKSFISSNYLTITAQGNGLKVWITPDPTTTDVAMVIRMHLLDLKTAIKNDLRSSRGITKAHLEDLLVRIDNALKPNKKS